MIETVTLCEPFRVMAAALSMMFGRIGGLIGNLVFGALIDTNCVFSIILFALLLLGEYHV